MKTVYTKVLFLLFGFAYLNFVSVDATGTTCGCSTVSTPTTSKPGNGTGDCVFDIINLKLYLYSSQYPCGTPLGGLNVNVVLKLLNLLGLNLNLGILNPIDLLNLNLKLALIIPGFTTPANSSYCYEVIQELCKKNYTVISLDWIDGACLNGISLIELLSYVLESVIIAVGQLLGSILVALFALIKVVVKTILIIGYGIGALLAGIIGQLLKGICIPSIIALEPPFGYYNCSSLCTSDGSIVTLFTQTLLNLDVKLGLSLPICNNGTVPSSCTDPYYPFNLILIFVKILLQI